MSPTKKCNGKIVLNYHLIEHAETHGQESKGGMMMGGKKDVSEKLRRFKTHGTAELFRFITS